MVKFLQQIWKKAPIEVVEMCFTMTAGLNHRSLLKWEESCSFLNSLWYSATTLVFSSMLVLAF